MGIAALFAAGHDRVAGDPVCFKIAQSMIERSFCEVSGTL